MSILSLLYRPVKEASSSFDVVIET